MDGLVVCAMASARHGRGFEPRFVCPSRGPLARPPPPPPSATRSTTGTAGASGGVSPHRFCLVMDLAQGLSKSKAPATTHLQQRAPPPGPLAAPEPHLLLILLFSEESNLHLQGSDRLHCRCGTRPKARIIRTGSQECTVLMDDMNRRLGLRPPHSHVIATVSAVI